MNHALNHIIPLLLLLQSAPASRSWTPFLDPLPEHLFVHWWLYLIPLSLFISIVYKAIRFKDLTRYPQAVLVMTIQIIAGMIGLTIGSYLLVELIVPFLRG